MTDRELLEAAAKAAGLLDQLQWWEGGFIWKAANAHAITKWNPLTDDGDAMRLAVALRLDIRHFGHLFDEVSVGGSGRLPEPCDEPHGEDPCAATRRAILRAAAAVAMAEEEKRSICPHEAAVNDWRLHGGPTLKAGK